MPWTPPKPPTDSEDSGGGNSGNTDAIWMPKWQDDIFVNTTTPEGVANASDYNSPTYNYTSSSTNAASEFGSGEGYMSGDMSKWINQVAKGIHPLKTGKTLWEDAVAASKSLWENHGVRKTPYQIVAEWAQDVEPKGGDGDGRGGSGYGSGSGGLGTPTPNPDEIRRAMDSVSMNLIGRTLSDKEFSRYYTGFAGEFQRTGGNMDPAQDMIEAVRQDDNYQEYQVATKFAGALDSVLKGAL